MRMEKLKSSIQQAYEDIEEEKRKNTELLNLIFPSDIAEKLWNGRYCCYCYYLLYVYL